MIDFGPDSKGAVEKLIDLSRRCRFILIRGNYEEMLFRSYNSPDDRRYWDLCGGAATRMNYPDRDDHELIDPDHLRFLMAQSRDFFETEDFIFVHASYDPNRPVNQQSNTTLHSLEHIDPGADASPLLGQAGHRWPYPADQRRGLGSRLPERRSTPIAAGVDGSLPSTQGAEGYSRPIQEGVLRERDNTSIF